MLDVNQGYAFHIHGMWDGNMEWVSHNMQLDIPG